MRNKLKNPLLFVLALIPIAAVGGVFTIMYSFNLYEPSMQETILASVSSYGALVISSALQTVMIAVVCGFIGYLISDEIGLMRRFTFEKNP